MKEKTIKANHVQWSKMFLVKCTDKQNRFCFENYINAKTESDAIMTARVLYGNKYNLEAKEVACINNIITKK